MIIPENEIIRNDDYNTKSLVVINSKGRLWELPIPMRARCIVDLNEIPIDTWIRIEEVLMMKNGDFAYVVNGHPYPHGCFEIIIRLE